MAPSHTSRSSSIVLRPPGARPGRPEGSTGISGRHAAWRPMRRHRRILAALVVGALLASASVIGVRLWGSGACAPVRIVAAPEIAPLVAQVARRLSTCVFTVVPRTSSAEAAALALSDGSDPPHVWLPESSALLVRAHRMGAAAVPPSGVSVAASPMVMALAAAAVARLGPGRPTWPALFAAQRVDPLVVGSPDPSRDPVGLAALLAAHADFASTAGGDAGLAAFLRELQGHVVGQDDDLFARLPGTAQPMPPISAFPTTEQELLRHNVAHADAALTAAYPDVDRTWMDYPFTVLGTATPPERASAARLLAALQDTEGQVALGAGGFRAADGRTLQDRSADGRTVRDLPAPIPLVESAASDDVLQRWATATRSGRIEVLIDISGSMNAVVPKLGVTRLAAALDATARGLPLFGPTTSVGLWTFAARLDGDRDYRQVVPVTPVPQLLNGRAAQALRSIRAVPGGRTGLYDSVLGLYDEARRNWEPDKLNVVVVMTDGNNDDPAGISRAELLRRLAAEADPVRPVTVIGVAIGPDGDAGELDQITRATGGRSFVVTDPRRIGDVFFAALGALGKG